MEFCPHCQAVILEAQRKAMLGCRESFPSAPGACCRSYWEGYNDAKKESGKLFFSYDPEDGFELHETEQEARDKAEEIMDACRDYAADDGWPEDMPFVCWGVVKQRAVETRRWASDNDHFDYMAEWELKNVEG